MNQKIIICWGASGSGKTTWSTKSIKENPNFVRVNRDDIRKQLVGILDQSYYKRKDLNSLEKQVTYILFANIRHLLQHDFNVIIDNTHLKMSYINEIIQEFNHLVDIEIKTFFVPLNELKQRVRNREDKRSFIQKLFSKSKFDTNYIEKQYKDYQKVYLDLPEDIILKKNCAIETNYKLPATIICDLDGTLSLFDRKLKSPYDRDFENDITSPQVIFILQSWLLRNPNGKVTFFSGRDSKFHKQTVQFLSQGLDTKDYNLYMRDSRDNRKDYIIKEEMFNTRLKDKYWVQFVVDDRLQVCRLWNKLGLFVINVNQELKEF